MCNVLWYKILSQPQISIKLDEILARDFQMIVLNNNGTVMIKFQSGCSWCHHKLKNYTFFNGFSKSNLCLDVILVSKYFLLKSFPWSSQSKGFLICFCIRGLSNTEKQLKIIKLVSKKLATWKLGSGMQFTQGNLEKLVRYSESWVDSIKTFLSHPKQQYLLW